ncbi:MAG: fatty acid desaturase [Burkholderiales bacterium]
MRKILANAQYGLTLALIILTALGILKGGIWTWSGVFILLALIVLDTVSRAQTPGTGVDETGKLLGIPAVLNTFLYFSLPVDIFLLFVLAWRVFQYAHGVPIEAGELLGVTVTNGITGWQLVGATLSAGFLLGMSNVFAHELAHTKGCSHVIGRWVSSFIGAAHFCIAHVYQHHQHAGCPEVDPATCPRGWSLYKFFLHSHVGQSLYVRDFEASRLAKLGTPFWSWNNRWLRGYAMTVPAVALLAFAGGWIGIAVMVGFSIVGIFSQEAFNYLEHYGLIRAPGQPIEYRHSWDNDTAFNNALWIEIGRQADHHDRGDTHFWELAAVGAPNTGWGYLSLFPLALIPPLWDAYMKRCLAEWDRNFASPEERLLAEEANRKAGWTMPADPTYVMKVNGGA